MNSYKYFLITRYKIIQKKYSGKADDDDDSTQRKEKKNNFLCNHSFYIFFH